MRVPRGVFEWLMVSVAAVVLALNVGLRLIPTSGHRAPRPQVKSAAKALPPEPTVEPVAPLPPPRRRAPRKNTFSITATRGRSWLRVRSGSERGAVLYEGTLGSDETFSARSTRLWVSFGAAGNVDLEINGEALPLPLDGTVSAVIGPHGVLQTSAGSPEARGRTTFAISASRGDSWLDVRAGSRRGRSLFSGLLRRGEILRLRAPRLWVRFGAAANVDVSVNRKRLALPLFGTYDAFVGPAGVRTDRRNYATATQPP